MSSIKPPDGRIPGAGASQVGENPGVERAGGGFDAALERARAESTAGATSSAGVQQAASSGAADPIAELARAVRGGAITKDQAIDRLIERVAGGVEHTLSAPQRAELVAVLRASLQNDPALASLREALEG